MLAILARVAAVMGAVALLLYALVFDVWTVPSDDPLLAASIAPTLAPGDVVLVARHSTLDHGYLARCPDPQAPGRFVAARAIARGGERVAFSREVVSVDGHPTPAPHACEEPGGYVVHDPRSDTDEQLDCEVEEYAEADFSVLQSLAAPVPYEPSVTVDPGKWFLVSDDRHVHLDSRDYGAVDAAQCRHVVARLARRGRFAPAVLW